MAHYCERKECRGKPAHLRGRCSADVKAQAQRRAQVLVKKKERREREIEHTAKKYRYERCGACKGMARVALGTQGTPLGFERHRAPGMNAWCRNGTQPSPKPTGKGSKKVKRSVRTVSGGLPTLGKR